MIFAGNEPDSRARTDILLFLIFSKKIISMVCAVRQIVDKQSVKIHPLHGQRVNFLHI